MSPPSPPSSSDLRLADAPGNVRLPATESRLPVDSVVNVAALTTLDKADLDEWLARVGSEVLRRVEAGLRLALDLDDRRVVEPTAGPGGTGGSEAPH